jgi:hypothetical protein
MQTQLTKTEFIYYDLPRFLSVRAHSGYGPTTAAASAASANTCSSIAATAVSVKVEQPEHTVLVAAGINS